jgi:tetratricopeptide (TPR) repeat protein
VKSLFYTLVLLAVLAASVSFLSSLDKRRTPGVAERSRGPVTLSRPPASLGIDRVAYADTSAEELYAIGAELLSLWHEREAATVFEQAVAVDSTHHQSWLRLVECYAAPLLARFDDAKEAWRRAVETSPDPSDTTWMAGIKSLFLDRHYRDAADQLGGGSATSRKERSYYLALAQLEAGRLKEARVTVEKLLKGNDAGGRAAALSIRCHVAAGELDAASSEARNLARTYAEEPYPYVLLSQVEFLRGRTPEAIEFCNNALVIDSRYVAAIVARANLYATEQEFEPARVSFEKLLLFDDPVLRAIAMEGIGFVDFLSGRFDDGVSAMDEAIRYAILGGAVGYGLSCATALVGYLCELGERDAAESIANRWIAGFGDVPVALGGLRIEIMKGNLETARRALVQWRSNPDWTMWAGIMSVDYTEMVALAHIQAEEDQTALQVLGDDAGAGGPGVVHSQTRAFLRGYTAFRSGAAEQAGAAFMESHRKGFGVEFPYHADPVLYVESLFYLAETRIATGKETDALADYQTFLDFWGDADWNIQAADRAREKLAAEADVPLP